MSGPRRLPSTQAALAAAVVLVAAALVLHAEVLFGGRIYHNDDAADGYYPSHVAIVRAWSEGKLPTWERGSWCGWSLAADPYYGPFYPLTAVYALLGAARGLGWMAALHVVVAALGMLTLLRRRGLSWPAALLGGASFGFSSFMTVRIRHICFVESMAWLPWLLVGVDAWLRERRACALGGAMVAGGLLLLSGGLPLVLFFGLVSLAYAGPPLLGRLRSARASGERWLLAGGIGAAAVGALLVGAPQLLSTLAHLPLSPRMLGTDFDFASSYAWPHASYLGTLLMPDLLGTEERGQWFGQFNHWEMSGYYAGALVVLLAPAALLRARRRPELWALWGVSLVAVVLAFGRATPLHRLLFDHLPLYASLRCPTRALVMALFAWPLLAAEGLEALLERELSRRRALVGALVLLVASTATVIVATAVHGAVVSPPEQAVRAAVMELACVVGGGGVVLLLSLGGLAPRPLGALLLALLTLGELVWVGRRAVTPRPQSFAIGTERFAAIRWLEREQAHEQPTPGSEWRFAVDPYGPFRLHNVGMVVGLEGAGGYDSFSSWRLVHYLWVLNTGAPYPHPRLRDDLAAGAVRRFDSPLVDLLNVRWVIGPTRPGARWVERYRLPPGSPVEAKDEPLWDRRLAVWENPAVMPRAFVVYEAEVEPERPGESAADRDRRLASRLVSLDPRRAALLEEPPPRPLGGARPPTPARLTVVERDRVVIEAKAEAEGILVLSESFDPSWSARVDGQPVPLLRADYALRGVALSAGAHVVELRHRSLPAVRGLWAALVGLLLALALGLGDMLGRGRFRTPPPPG